MSVTESSEPARTARGRLGDTSDSRPHPSIAVTVADMKPLTTEAELHKTVADYLTKFCPVPWSTIGHGNMKLPPRVGARLKKLGLMPGLADIQVFIPDGTIHIELKNSTGVQSIEQLALGSWLNQQPHHWYHVCRTLEAVETALRSRGVELRAAAT